MMQTPRLRMFAGPNGSGKSTLKTLLPPDMLGHYLNPDEIEQAIRDTGYLDFSSYGLRVSEEEALAFIRNSPFLKSKSIEFLAGDIHFHNNRLDFSEIAMNSYIASVVLEFVRLKLLGSRQSFTFETVMSHPSKVDFSPKRKQVASAPTYTLWRPMIQISTSPA